MANFIKEETKIQTGRVTGSGSCAGESWLIGGFGLVFLTELRTSSLTSSVESFLLQ